MTPASKKIEVLANVAIILVAIILGVVLVKKFVFTETPTASAPPQPKVGMKAAVPETDFSGNDKNLILALKKDCRFCTESAGFYQKLVTATAEKNVRLMALFPHPVADGQAYLKELNVPVTESRQADFAALGVGGTPTIILVNKEGEIQKAWVGKLPPDKETEVLNSLQ